MLLIIRINWKYVQHYNELTSKAKTTYLSFYIFNENVKGNLINILTFTFFSKQNFVDYYTHHLKKSNTVFYYHKYMQNNTLSEQMIQAIITQQKTHFCPKLCFQAKREFLGIVFSVRNIFLVSR